MKHAFATSVALRAVASLAVTLLPALSVPVYAQPPGGAPAPVEAPAAVPPAVAAAGQRRDDASVAIEDIIDKVAARERKVFVVDPRVRARVFTSPKIENPTYEDLLAILRVHGFMAAEIDGRVNIVPDANARAMPVRLLQRDDANVPDDEYVTRVIEVPTPLGVQLVPLLRPLMPQAAHLAGLPGEEGKASKLIVVDTYANVRRITELVRTLAQ
jgi:type II secretory pathway component GspD/PulD (secretin)